jgi:ATP/maltotriose-dependent transcriptional regulator MalT
MAAGDLGRVYEALSCAERGFAISERSAKAAYQGVGVAEYAVSACVHAGLAFEATQVADRVWRRCVDVPGIARSVASAIAAIADLGAGRADSACQRLSAAVAEFEQLGDTSGLIYRYRIVWAEALGRTGDADAARAAESGMRHARHPGFGFVAVDELLASAWVAASDGDLGRAKELSTRAAESAASTGQLAREVISLQAAVGFGATGCASRLRELASLVEGPRAAVASRYAGAVERGKPAAVLAASDEFALFGDRLTAADAAAVSAQMFRAAGRRADEYRATGRARRLLHGTGAASPLLRDAITTLPLSEREQAIAALVAHGLTNRGIAERLVTSVRTVEGHVYRIGNKIGSRSRAELIAVLREWVDASPDPV